MTMLEMPGADTEIAADQGDAVAGPIHPGQWRLARVEVLNWGTFDGHHRIDVARQGHLFTGASGWASPPCSTPSRPYSPPDKWLRFNAAAQEAAARNDDRSLVSYVRGAWSKEADENLDRAVSSYLRTRATWSGILLRFENERDAPLTLVRLFHLPGSRTDRSDLKDACFADRVDISLLDFREHVASGIETRRIKKAWPDAVVTTTGSHAAFYSRMRRVLGVGTENALHLLHKTQSAKNLGSLDQLFRDFMLDEPPTFARAKNAVEQFGELKRAYEHVVELRKQKEHLHQLDSSIIEYETAAATAAETERLGELIDPFHDQFTLRLAHLERAELRSKQARAGDESARADAARAAAADALRAAQRQAMQLGGSDAADLHERLTEALAAADATGARWARFAEELSGVGVDTAPQSATEFAEFQEASGRALAENPPEAAHQHDDNERFFTSRAELARIDGELTALRTRKSNLPAALLLARTQLAAEIGVAETALPFAGELIEVAPQHAEWSGAMERVLYPLASALLVRDEYLAEVRRRVEAPNLGARLVYEAVPALPEKPRAARSERSLLHRISVSEGPFRDWLRARTAAEFDYVCVDHPDELDAVERGVTIGGQLKKSARRYEKNDRYRVDDRSRWILGADNEAKIDLLLDRRRDAENRHREAEARLADVQAARDALTKRRTVLERAIGLDWSEVDRAAATELVRVRTGQLATLTESNVELRAAIVAEAEAREHFGALEDDAREKDLTLRGLTATLEQIGAQIAQLTTRVVNGALTDADAAALEARYRSVQRKIDRISIGEVGRKVSEALSREARIAQSRASDARSAFVLGAGAFKSRWPSASADLTTEIADRAGYRALLEGIVARGLPEHEGNFLKLLREKSRDLIGHLASDIRDAPKLVEDRIEPVNASLGRSRFDVERYLRIIVKTKRAPEVVAFMADLKTIVDGAWSDEDLAAAEQRFALLNQLMQRLASSDYADLAWKRRCLDTREHVAFMVHEVDLAGRVVSVHDSSAGPSGGQRQKLVIFCLAAALRYQLAAAEDELPSYATIILDEAFDKADSQYTRMAMDVFVEFGFPMILPTPQKLLQTIEPYVGAVTSISNPSRKQSLTAAVVFRTHERD